MIKLSNVSKNYGSFVAVRDISLQIAPGSIFAFLGINGAGKTTTIRMMAGILRPTSGTISLGGYDISTQPLEAKQIIGYVPDRPYIYPKLSGREFLYFICDLYRVPPSQADSNIDQVLEEYSLTPWQDSLIESYSHGMKQRIAMCAAMVHKPQILIVDEPMVGLDPRGAHDFKESLKRYAQAGLTVFLSTHSLNVAQELADHMAIIHRGAILTNGTFDEIQKATGVHTTDLEEMFLELTASGMSN
jgi:ABC-2 type transport system ATP-binding protein